MCKFFILCLLSLTDWTMAADAQAVKIVHAARKQIGKTTSYDPAYRGIPYPNGDVPLAIGVCSDVVVRAFRGAGLDLQKSVHEDMTRNFGAYPKNWGLNKPDSNIDHRRVPNLQTFLDRKGCKLPITDTPGSYHPADIVVWRLENNLLHIGIVSDRSNKQSIPLIIHNIGAGAQEEDLLFRNKIIAHYRWRTNRPSASAKSLQSPSAK